MSIRTEVTLAVLAVVQRVTNAIEALLTATKYAAYAAGRQEADDIQAASERSAAKARAVVAALEARLEVAEDALDEAYAAMNAADVDAEDAYHAVVNRIQEIERI